MMAFEDFGDEELNKVGDEALWDGVTVEEIGMEG